MMSRWFLRGAATVGGVVTAGGMADRALAPRMKQSKSSIRLYQYDICPFCSKVKALLDLHQVPYETIEVNPLMKREIKFSADYQKVPIAMLDGEQVNDSPVIASRLLDSFGATDRIPKDELAAFRSKEAMEWAAWSDTKLAVLLFPNITRSWGEAYQAFGYVMDVPHFSLVDKWSNQLIGAFAMWMAQGKIKKKYQIDDERAAVREALATWMSGGVGDKPFAGGDRPNMADVCVFGALKAIDRTDAHAEIMAETSVAPWYDRMHQAVSSRNSCVQRE